MDCQCHSVHAVSRTGSAPPGKYVLHLSRWLIAGALSTFMAAAWSQGSGPDCQCRAPDGGMRNLGTVECVDIVGTRKMVRCEMSTNTPYWKDIDGIDGCPDA